MAGRFRVAIAGIATALITAPLLGAALTAGAASGAARRPAGRAIGPAGSAIGRPAGGTTPRLGPIRELSSTPQQSEYPQLAMNATGAYVLAWPTKDPFGPFGRLIGRATGGAVSGAPTAFGTVADLSPLSVAVAPDGHTAILYGVRAGRGAHIAFGLDLTEPGHATARWTSQVVQPPANVDIESGGELALGSGGELAAAWTRRDGGTDSLVVATRPQYGAPITDTIPFTGTTGASVAALGPGLDAAGHLVLAFTTSEPVVGANPIAPEQAMAITTDASGQLGAPQLLRSGCQEQQLVVAPSGAAAISMLCNVGLDGFQVYVSERAPGQPFGAPILVSGSSGTDEFEPDVTIAPGGTVWVAWEDGNPRTKHEQVRTEVTSAPLGSPFPPAQWATSYANAETQPELVSAPNGTIYLVNGTPRDRLLLRALEPLGRLGGSTALSPPGSRDAEVAVDARGNGLAVWSRSADLTNRAEVRSFTLP